MAQWGLSDQGVFSQFEGLDCSCLGTLTVISCQDNAQSGFVMGQSFLHVSMFKKKEKKNRSNVSVEE